MKRFEAIQRKVVGILGDGSSQQFDRLFEVLGLLFPVEFHRVGPGNQGRVDGLIVLHGDLAAGLAAADRGTPAYVVAEGNEAGVYGSEVRFGESPLLEKPFAGQLMHESDVRMCARLEPAPGDVVLAAKDGRPVWLARRRGAGVCQLVAMAPPLLREKQYLTEHFQGGRFLRLLPLMNFLRQVAREVDWETPVQHACFVFDDPSLYWPTYGFVNYRLLAEHAREHDYFVSVATIPVDSWWVHRGVADLFRSQHPRLSLLIHGNNHTSNEMLCRNGETDALQTAAQALRRISRLERKHGLSVCRVMEAPHGAIAEEAFQHLLALGYEAALLTPGLMFRHNPRTTWPPTIGLDKSAVVGGGLPGLPRIRVSPFWRNDVLLAAFLRQPIVVAGHHQDAARGMDFLANVARAVNGLGPVVWSDMRGILRGNYLQRTMGDLLLVRMYARSVRIPIPAGIREMSVERTWLEKGQTEKIVIGSSRGTLFAGATGQFSPPLPVQGGEVLEVTSERANPLDFSAVGHPAIHPWPIARKVLMEARDRLMPALSLIGLGLQSTGVPPP